jgi:hypothetical protein
LLAALKCGDALKRILVSSRDHRGVKARIGGKVSCLRSVPSTRLRTSANLIDA